MKTIRRLVALSALVASLAACQTLRSTLAPSAPRATDETEFAEGVYDNHEQVWAAQENRTPLPPPRLVAELRTPSRDWRLLVLRTESSMPTQATWALHRAEAGWVPHRALVAPAARFDAAQWTPLDACVLRADGARWKADVATCTALAPGLGTDAAMLPIELESRDEWLHVRLFSDQARGVDAHEQARRVREYAGWVALNGAGADAATPSGDWHMDKAVRLGNEGGRYPLRWRDGKPSGHSLRLERLTYRDGNVPVLKLSVVDDASGRVFAYAWANPEAARIGLSLGWVQIGLERSVPGTGGNAQ